MHISIENALLRADRLLVLAANFLRAGLDERFHRQDAQRKHVELPKHGDPGREVERTDDHAERADEKRFGRGRNAVVPQQAISKLAVSRHVYQDRFCTRKYSWQGGAPQPTAFRCSRGTYLT